MKKIKQLLALSLVVALFSGCAVAPKSNRNLAAYNTNMPKSILVLPPVNESPDTRATYGYWSTVTLPVAEAGYYVFPISVVDTMFKENGVTNGFDAHAHTSFQEFAACSRSASSASIAGSSSQRFIRQLPTNAPEAPACFASKRLAPQVMPAVA